MFAVIVGNVGIVYEGKSKRDANVTFREYAKMSADGYGRVGGEPVVLMKDGEPLKSRDGDNRE